MAAPNNQHWTTPRLARPLPSGGPAYMSPGGPNLSPVQGAPGRPQPALMNGQPAMSPAVNSATVAGPYPRGQPGQHGAMPVRPVHTMPSSGSGVPSLVRPQPPTPSSVISSPTSTMRPFSLLPAPAGSAVLSPNPPSSMVVSPGPSEPSSAKSSRGPTPIHTPKLDFVEGQPVGLTPSNSASNLHALNQPSVMPGMVSPFAGVAPAPQPHMYPPTSSVYSPLPPQALGSAAGRPPALRPHLSFSQPQPSHLNNGPVAGPSLVSSASPARAPLPPSYINGPLPASSAQTHMPSTNCSYSPSPYAPREAIPTSANASPLVRPPLTSPHPPPHSTGPPPSVRPPSGDTHTLASIASSAHSSSNSPYVISGSKAIVNPTATTAPSLLPPAPAPVSSSYPAYPPLPVTNGTSTPAHPNRRYPQPNSLYPASNYPGPLSGGGVGRITHQMGDMSVTQHGFNKIWGSEMLDLLQTRHILPPDKGEPPKVALPIEYQSSTACSPDIFRCTLTKMPETAAVLQKSRLPLGVLIHPFKDLSKLPVIQCNTIVRCRACRTYINPYVYFIDQRRWKCNLCYRANDLPEEFQYDPVSKTYGDPSRRPEIKSSTIEFIAPSEYMLRPPQPSVYLFILDVSYVAVETGYLKLYCDTLLEELDKLPGDSRTQIGFVTVDSSVHFYSLCEGASQPRMLVVGDVDDVFIPCPDTLLANLSECRELVQDLLTQLPGQFLDTHDTRCALGAALQVAYKLMAPTGGRVTVMVASLPNHGPGALKPREDPNLRAGKDVAHLGPATDFYKKLALDCSSQQVAVDLWVLSSQYTDIATLSGISKFSGGCIYYFPGLHISQDPSLTESFERALKRYLTRKIGFEAVMRIRCTRGLAIHTFHGNFFVRSTDLLSLPNVNPDTGFGMQVSIEDSLSDTQTACFQAALLYTSSKGERRIRVHTLCLPISGSVAEVIQSADQDCVMGLLAKMAVDRCITSSLSDARDAFVNVAIDVLSAYRTSLSSPGVSSLEAPFNLRLVPLYVLALLKHMAFRHGLSTKLDERVFAMCEMKTLPLSHFLTFIYPSLYSVGALGEERCISEGDLVVPQPPRLHLSSEKVDSNGAYLMDAGNSLYLYVCRGVGDTFCIRVLNVPNFISISQDMCTLPELDTAESERLRNLVNYIQGMKPYPVPFRVIREDSKWRSLFLQHLVEDRSESAFAYYEFLQHLKTKVK